MYTHRYHVCKQELQHAFETKGHGDILDSNISLRDHIANKVNQANSITDIRYATAKGDNPATQVIHTPVLRDLF